ncbi:MAG: double-strand break repair helicase AddA [Aestuariivirga sp.]
MSGGQRASLLQRRASDPAASAWVNANAGSGKTHVLVDRLIRLMLTGTAPSRILCLTFTKAAAVKMSADLLNRLSGWSLLPDDTLEQNLRGIGLDDPDAETIHQTRRLFTTALETPGGLKIQTIHAFCEKLLQLFPVEAGIIPHFTVLDDRGASEMLAAARREVLGQARRVPEGEIATALAEVVAHARADDFDALLKILLKERANLAPYIDGDAGAALAAQDLYRHFSLSPGNAAFTFNAPDYRRLVDALNTGSKTDLEGATKLAKLLVSGTVDYEILRSFYLTEKDKPRQRLATKEVIRSYPWIEVFLSAEQPRFIEALRQSTERECIAATSSLLTLAGAILRTFEREKRRRGAYDFDDLILRTYRLLSQRPDAAWVLYKLDGGIEHVLLDEAQDMSPSQWEIVRTLTEEFFSGHGVRGQLDRTLFAVGDRKQSIFSFQGADPDSFEVMHEDFQTRIKTAGQAFNDVDFTISYRSTSAILNAVDTVFHESRMARRGLDGRTARLLQHEPNRRQEPGTFEIWPLVTPDDQSEDRPWQAPVDREPANSPRRKLARMIAGKVKSWIGQRTLVAEKRPVRPGDILILVRTRNPFFDALIRELRKADIPVAGADRLQLLENIAVMDLLALARTCLLADDDYSLACLLKSPLLPEPFSEDRILELAHNRGSRLLWERMLESAEPQCVAAVRQLSLWKEEARTARPYEFFAGVLGLTRMNFLSRLGSEARDVLDAFLNAALDYERDNPSSLQGFVHWFSSGDVEIKRDMEQGSNEVRIMTVHGAKGLEAPIVILPDTVSIPDGKKQSPLLMIETGNTGRKLPLWKLPKRFESAGIAALMEIQKDARSHEYRRLLYVAMTRARDELYVCGYGGRNKPGEDCWYNLVASAMRPEMRETGDEAGWRLGADPVFAGGAAEMAKRRVEIPAWASRVPKVEPDSTPWSRPSHLAGTGPPPQFNASRLQGLERGVLIHRILQLLPDVPHAKRRDFVARVVKRAGYEESLATEISRLIERPDIVSLFGSDGLSEIPIMAGIAALGRRISGRIDRLILRPDEISAVDYKTDGDWPLEPASIKPEYLLQMAAYREALKDIHPGMRVRCAILWTEAPILMEIPDSLLDITLHHNSVGPP